MKHILDITLSTAASTLRYWKGTGSSKKDIQPKDDLILFDREGDVECRRVREVLTALNLNVLIAPCPLNGKNIKKLKRDSGSDQVPTLYDTNTEEHRSGAVEIICYLYKQYRMENPPQSRIPRPLDNLSAHLATLIRQRAGLKARPSRIANQALTLYSFESSPFSRPVRELLCELELPYRLINLGKQQWADMGPAKAHFTLKPYKPLPGTKREAFFEQHGNVQVPYLIDPNTNTALFESREIIKYLEDTYAL